MNTHGACDSRKARQAVTLEGIVLVATHGVVVTRISLAFVYVLITSIT
jgi:hypothetical protein